MLVRMLLGFPPPPSQYMKLYIKDCIAIFNFTNLIWLLFHQKNDFFTKYPRKIKNAPYTPSVSDIHHIPLSFRKRSPDAFF